MRVLFVASEGLPFSKTGGLADVIEALPKALVAQGHEVAVVLPRYRGNKVADVVLNAIPVPIGPSLRFPSIREGGRIHNVQYYFLDDPAFFDREQLYGADGRDYPDNALRFAELAYAAIELCKHVWRPDVIHCHDWQSALVPVLMRTRYSEDRQLQQLPVVFTIHNIGYQGIFPASILGQAALPESLFSVDRLEFYGQINYLKGALVYSDYLTTVSRKYAQEIQTPEYGHGLDGVIRMRADRLTGILNGVDYSIWNPELDPLIAARYSARDMAGKQICKSDLLAEFRLPAANKNVPVIGIVSRFADQKGFDLVAQIASDLLHQDVMLVAIGSGEAKYEQMFMELAQLYPQKIAAKIVYDNTLAHKIEAGADIFLMPSRYEPCGLNQIYSLRYGTVPVVRATGGLDDTIEPFDNLTRQGTGFKFHAYSGEALMAALRDALGTYRDAEAWRCLQLNGMTRDFSWEASAKQYEGLYETARKARVQ
jgi:starch synthase